MKKKIDFGFLRTAGMLSFSNVLNSASNGIIIVLLNKFLSPTESGTFLFLLAIASPLFIFISFDLRRKVTAHQIDNLSLPDIFSIRNILALSGVVCFVILGLTVSKLSDVSLVAIGCIAVGKIFDSVTEINYAIFQYYNHEKLILISRIIKLSSCLVAFFLIHTRVYEMIFLLYTITSALPFLFYEIWWLKKLDKTLSVAQVKISWKILVSFVTSNISLAVASLIMALSPNLPNYFIKYYMNVGEVTYFSSINFIISTIYLTGSGIGFALIKKMKVNPGENFKASQNIIIKSSLITFGTYAAAAVLIHLTNALTLIFNQKYEHYYFLLDLLLLSGVLYTISSYLNNFLMVLNERRNIFNLRLIRLFATMALCFIFPMFFRNLNAFGYALVVTNLIDCMLHVWLIVKKQNEFVKTSPDL